MTRTCRIRFVHDDHGGTDETLPRHAAIGRPLGGVPTMAAMSLILQPDERPPGRTADGA